MVYVKKSYVTKQRKTSDEITTTGISLTRKELALLKAVAGARRHSLSRVVLNSLDWSSLADEAWTDEERPE